MSTQAQQLNIGSLAGRNQSVTLVRRFESCSRQFTGAVAQLAEQR